MDRIKNLKDHSKKCSGSELPDLNVVTQDVTRVMTKFLRNQELLYPISLGPGYLSLSKDDVDANLRTYRLGKKWKAVSNADKAARRKSSIEAMLAFDANGPEEFSCSVSEGHSLDPWCERILTLARFDLEKALAKHYRFNPASFRFPEGETFKSAGGDVSIYAKLRDVEQLCVTADCFDLAAEILYKVPGFKRAVKAHFPHYTHHDVKSLNQAFARPDGAVDGFEVFKVRLLDVVTFVDGMRLETVPKDNEVDRVIACEPFLNMLVQSVIEMGIRNTIRAHYGIDLNTSQDLHALLISDLQNATIDVKNASNSFFMRYLHEFYGNTTLHGHIVKARSPYAIFDGQKYPLKMVSPMGNGFTFGYMTLTILAIARQLDTFAHVFGDDIIIDRDVAPVLICALERIGCIINTKKTFITGGFRESCGAFYSTDHYVRSYEFSYPETFVDCIVLTNKVGILAREFDEWGALHAELLDIIPPVFYGWYNCLDLVKDPDDPFGPDIESRYVQVYDNKRMRKKAHDSLSISLKQAELAARREWLSEIQYTSKEVTIVGLVSYKKDRYRSIPTDNLKPAWVSYYLYTGRCSAPERRVSARKRKLCIDVEVVLS